MKYLIYDHSKDDFVELEKPFLLFYGVCENTDHVLLTDCLFNSYEIDKTDLTNCFPGIPDFKSFVENTVVNSCLSIDDTLSYIDFFHKSGYFDGDTKDRVLKAYARKHRLNANDLY